jgi:hypothetical protein
MNRCARPIALLRHLIQAMLLLALARCGNLTELAGAGVETTNGFVIGSLVRENGLPDSNALVRLFPAEYNPLTNANAVPLTAADEAGRFEFNRIGTGTYTVVAAHASLGTKAATYKIQVAGDTVRLAADTMRPPGSIKIKIPERCDMTNGNFYIPGTGLIVSLKNASGGSVIIDSVPAGEIPGILYAVKSSAAAPQVLVGSVIVPSAGTITIAFAEWAFSRRIALNTTSSGAGIPSDIIGFPVLIRIDRNNFNFSEAKADGSDLRFAKSDGSPLPYEIERWDPVTELAEVWVRVDTVRGNDSTQSIMMYWGNPNASDGSNGVTVFDTANSFLGVWHLNENGDSVYDATADAFHGANSGSIMAAGTIGNSRKFADGNYLKISGLLNSPSNVTLSAWVQSDKSTGSQDIISIGDAVMIRLDDYLFGKGTSGWYHNSPINYDDSKYAIDSSGRYLANTGWHYLTYAINSETHVQTLYIDGVQSVAINDTNPIYYAGLGADTYIGIHGNGKTTYNFGGQIDEVRVSGIAESPDWVKLCFMNQKVPDALVKW